MPIEWRADGRQLHLYNDRISYLMRVLESGTLAHLYFGPRLATEQDYAHFLRTSLNAVRGEDVPVREFRQLVNQKLEPSPGLDCKPISPPMSPMSSLLIARPSPVPESADRSAGPLPRTKREKI